MTIETPAQLEKEIRARLSSKFYEGLSPERMEQLNQEIHAFHLFPEFFETYVEWSDDGACVNTNENGLISPYVLGLTTVNPIEEELEPYIWSQHGDSPDIDTDIEDKDRTFEICQELFGVENVGAISNFNELKVKTALKDVARIYGIDPQLINRLTTGLPDDVLDADTIGPALEASEELRQLVESQQWVGTKYNMTIDTNSILGQHRTVGRHAGGVIVAEGLFRTAPILRAGHIMQVGYTKHNCEKMGFIKLDLLGLTTLRMISDCIHEILHHHEDVRQEIADEIGEVAEMGDGFNPFDYTAGEFASEVEKDEHELSVARRQHKFKFIRGFYNMFLSPEIIDFDDQKVYETVYQDGRFCGVFQMDSEGMRKTTQSFSPNCIGDISAAVAIYRPGPLNAGVNEKYAENKRRFERGQITEEHPIIDSVLESTYGLMVYQEQIMALGAELGGYSPELVQRFRQNVIKKGKDRLTPELAEEREMLKSTFIEGAEKNGYPKDKALALWDNIEGFSQYSFNLSHSLSYGVNSYITAWLLTYYKVEWYCSVLNNSSALEANISEVLADGISVLPPDVAKSKMGWSISRENGVEALRFGISSIKDIGEKAAHYIILAQRGDEDNDPVSNVWDFFESELFNWRSVNAKTVRALIGSGCFERYEDDILEHFTNMREFEETICATGYRKLFTDHGPEGACEKIREKYERWEKRYAKWEDEMIKFEMGAREKKPVEPKEPARFWGVNDWSERESTLRRGHLLNYLAPPDSVLYTVRDHAHSVLSKTRMPTDDFISLIQTGSVPIDEHPQYSTTYVPRCWFRIIGIQHRATKKGNPYVVFKAMGRTKAVDIRCWNALLVDDCELSDYVTAFIEYDDNWGYSISRRAARPEQHSSL